MRLITKFRLSLSFVLVFWAIAAFLAGTDIYMGIEDNLNLEWAIVWWFFGLSLLLVTINVCEFMTLNKIKQLH